jgi:hypothetical protein
LTDPVREEAERLVAAAIGSLATAARSFGAASGRQGAFATGSDECCICPICRVIAAMREPDADLAERLATGAGDLAAAVTGVLRSLSRTGFRGAGPASRDPDADEAHWPVEREEPEGPGSASRPWAEPGDPWRAATAPPPHKPMAKKAVKKAAVKKATAKKAAAKKATKKATGGGGTG